MLEKSSLSIENALADAKAKRDELSNKLIKISDIIQYLEGYISSAKSLANLNIPLLGKDTINIESQRFEDIPAIKAAEIILKENGKPIHIKVIIEKIIKGGYKIQTDQHKMYSSLYTSMKRKPKIFIKIKDKEATFGLIEWE